MKVKLITLTLLTTLILSACGGKKMVQFTTPNDHRYSCKQIVKQQNAIHTIQNQAQAGGQASPQQIHDAVIFRNIATGRPMPAKNLIKAADAREVVLFKLAAQRKCNQP